MRIYILLALTLICLTIPTQSQSTAADDNVIQLKQGFTRFIKVVWSPDGTKVLTSDELNSVKIWDAVTGTILDTLQLYPDDPEGAELSHDKDVEDIAWSPDGSIIATAGDSRIILWDAATGDTIRALRSRSPRLIAWSPDGRRIATKSYIEIEGQFRVVLWDASTGAILDTLTKTLLGEVKKFAWSPDGSKLLTTGIQIGLWDAATGEFIRRLNPGGKDAEWSPDGTKLLATFGDTLKIYDAESGALIRDLAGHPDRRWVEKAIWSPDGSKVAGACQDSTAKIWDAQSGELLHILRHYKKGVWDVAWNPDGTKLATACTTDYTPRIWDAASGALLDTMSALGTEVVNISWSPDGNRVATRSQHYSVLLWLVDPPPSSVEEPRRPALTGDIAMVIHPNPVNDRAEIAIQTVTTGRTQIVLMDMMGREIAIVYDDVLSAGRHVMQLETAGMATGNYFLHLRTPTGTGVMRMSIVR